jgi:putative transposase
MAASHRRPGEGVLHHSDRGSQYASHNYQRLLSAHQMVCSMSRKGDCYDNAMMESFFSTLKSECADEVFDSRAQARHTIFEYIEVWYNRQRRRQLWAIKAPKLSNWLIRPTSGYSPTLLKRGKPSSVYSSCQLNRWKPTPLLFMVVDLKAHFIFACDLN